MNSQERNRGNAKWDGEENSDLRSERAGEEGEEEEEEEGSDRKKHRASRSSKYGNGEETEKTESGGRRRSSGEKVEVRRKSCGSSRANGDDIEYDSRKESRSKHARRKQEESTLEKLSNWYQDGELENKQDGGSRGHGRGDESDRKKLSSKLVDNESAQIRSRSEEEKPYDGDSDKVDKDYRHSEKRESTREKGFGSSEQSRNSRRRWDEADTVKKDEDPSERGDCNSGRNSDPKYESNQERNFSARNESVEIKSKGADSSSDGGVKSNNKEERRAESERGKTKVRSEFQEISREDITENSRHNKSGNNYDRSASWDKSVNADENGSAHPRDRTASEGRHTSRSKNPEKSSRLHQDSEQPEMEYERSTGPKRKEPEKGSYRDDRSKNKDDGWNDRKWDREGSKDGWKRRQFSNYNKDSKNGDAGFDQGREWDFPRHGRERIDNERPLGRAGHRKDGNRGEAIKTSSNFGISNENYDVIEIQTKPIDYGRPESVSNFSMRAEAGRQPDFKSASNEEELTPQQDDKVRKTEFSGCETPDDEATSVHDQNSWRDNLDFYGGKCRDQRGVSSARSTGGPSSGVGSQLQHGNQDSGSFNRGGPQGLKGNRNGSGVRGRPTGRDSQLAIPLPLTGSPFGPFGMPPPGPMQPHNPSMSPAPGPPISPGVFIPPFAPPMCSGPRVLDMNLLAVPPVPHGGVGPRFAIGNPPNPALYFNQPGPARGPAPNMSNHSFNTMGSMGRGTPPDKAPGGWVPPRSGGPPGKAPSRGEQNDYSQNFVDTGMRPQNFIRELELTNVVEDYPKLRELIQKKDEIVSNSASAPMYLKCDLKEFELTPEYFGTKFDVILVDPPWEEYVHRAPGVADHMDYWTFEEIVNLKIEAIADTPSFIFLWVGDGVGLEQGRQCLKKWGFRRCEDICWVKTNKSNATPGLRHDSHTLFQHSKEHCLMGIKGTVRRSTDGHIIHANIDTDVIIAEEPPYGSTQKPEDMYRIIEHFALGRRRLELFGEDHNIRAGWLTVGKGLTSSNFNSEAYIKNFADKDGKVWLGGGGRNPPPEAPHLVLTTPDIEALRPKSPMKNQQQMQQQQSSSISLTPGNSSSRRPTGNSPQNPNVITINQEASSSNPSNKTASWGPPMEGFKGRDSNMVPSDEIPFDMYGYNGKPNFVDFDSYRHMNTL